VPLCERPVSGAAGILISAGVTHIRIINGDHCIRTVLNLMRERFGIATPHAISVEMWEEWGRDADLMRTLTNQIAEYAAAVNYHTPVERLSHEDQARIQHLLLPPLPRQLRERFVPMAEHRAAQRRRRKAKQMYSASAQLPSWPSCSHAIPPLNGSSAGTDNKYSELIPASSRSKRILCTKMSSSTYLTSLARTRPASNSSNGTGHPCALRSRSGVRYEFSYRRYTDWMNQTKKGSKSHDVAWLARYNLQRRAKEPTPIYANRRAYFVEAHLGDGMPWFMGPLERWFRGLGQGRNGKTGVDGRTGMCHAGVGTPDDWLVRYFGDHLRSDRLHGRCSGTGTVWFEPEAAYRGVLFGSAIVTLMLTADARAHEVLQISADRFVRPVRVYVVKNTDGTPKRDPATNRIVTDVIVQQRFLPKGRKHDDLRLEYDVSAARVHLQEITRLLKATHHGEIPVVRYDPFHSKAEHLGAERYLFQWNGRHVRKAIVNGLIRFVLDGIELVDRAGAHIDVTSHMLRHTAATVQHQQYGVPLEVLTEAMGHTLTASGEAPEATRYYSQMTENQKAEIRHDTILAIMDDARLAVRVIDPEDEAERIERMMADADERTREVLERYGGLHPVTFGHCGYPGLCVRGTARSFCLGCPFLVRRPQYFDRVDFLLESYLTAADAHERMGDLAGARERKRLIAELRQLRSEMLLLAEAERDGTWTPRWKAGSSLPAAEA
jgi:hypothetical protein